MEILRRRRTLQAMLVQQVHMAVDLALAPRHNLHQEVSVDVFRADDLGAAEDELPLKVVNDGVLDWEEVPFEKSLLDALEGLLDEPGVDQVQLLGLDIEVELGLDLFDLPL